MFGGGVASAHQVIKKLKMDHLWVYTLYPTSGRNGYRLKIIDKKKMIKNQKAHASY